MTTLEKVRVLVVGDSGVGKSCLVHLICHNQVCSNPSYTIGAAVDVKIHEYKEGTPKQKSYFIELWDVGGSVNHSNSRHVFYNQVNGIILVHELTNRKSQLNLRKWLAEVLSRDNGGGRSKSTSEYDPEQFAGCQVPILVLGTKADQVDSKREAYLSNTSLIAEECGADEFNLDCLNVKHLAPGSTNSVKLSRFFDKVIDRRQVSRESSQFGSHQDRRRLNSQKSFHMD
ncbi:rab-like protein 3 isoform X3 [Anneissia japonica]|uniref:rab-like protein 3 isoform X3 n=1 Tax=Anneissia japonica TaxID=1529436 RepID=UPI001425963A|nr:rab-like protein 3 isoform X3 [Anneissia japonica]